MDGTQKATFAAGCFWGVQSAFDEVPGVVATTVGYTAGKLDNPTYKDVCYRDTGHAEAVLVEFDPSVVSYEQLLDEFWAIHNPTTLNRQGPDVGDQYRSAIYFHCEEQRRAAEESRDRLAASGKWPNPIVTQIVPAETFWPAEEYHQKYFAKSGEASCHVRY